VLGIGRSPSKLRGEGVGGGSGFHAGGGLLMGSRNRLTGKGQRKRRRLLLRKIVGGVRKVVSVG